ncbi:hypothetical protein [uncultured Streptomyces sp.]|uniref:hypothetical protein n=1 Tax=uncultured Streptomyces sp. TaxID=174707 RepID=UPI00262DA116|nr:hypothetical protein [uncultured Streptomyces sp.]
MDQYDRQDGPDGRPPATDDTPIYDKLLAEWRRAGRGPAQADPAGPAAGRRGGFVPAARTSPDRPGS